MRKAYSILYPDLSGVEYRTLSETVCHDLALDLLCEKVAKEPKEYGLIMGVISKMTPDARVAKYRSEVFSDILSSPRLRERMIELFDKFEFVRNFGGLHRNSDEKLGIWHLLRRMDELNDYIICVESMRDCLIENEVKSPGLVGFRKFVETLYDEACFGEMKKDIAELKVHSSEIKSVTVGINVNERFEATSMGLISINNKCFKKSGIVNNFAEAIGAKPKIQEGTDWNGDMHYQPLDPSNSGESMIDSYLQKSTSRTLVGLTRLSTDDKARASIANITKGDSTANTTFYLANIVNKMLDSLVRKLRETLNKYSDIVVVNISQLIPEFIYYIRLAEFIEKNIQKGYLFCKPEAIEDGSKQMEARDFYNLKLAISDVDMNDIILNDLDFDPQHSVYILTGANRGGKTTVTQAVGILYVLAQGGIFVPAKSFMYKPVDCVFTHFPADEDKTLDLGRLGEECIRFKEDFSSCTNKSLYLLNESFSTTSFEEGYYIARDSVRALLNKGIRTIYNTHMHKLGYDVEEFNNENPNAKASSLIVKSDNGQRSFKIEVAPPEGMSYARDIAEKYGVTYEKLTGRK